MKLWAFLLGLWGFVFACIGLVADVVPMTAVGVGMLGASVLASWYDQ